MPCKDGLSLRDSKTIKVQRWLEGESYICQLKPSHSLGKNRRKVHRNIRTCMSVSHCHKGFDRIKWTIVNVYHGSIWSVVSAECPSFHCLFACVLWISWTGSGCSHCLAGKGCFSQHSTQCPSKQIDFPGETQVSLKQRWYNESLILMVFWIETNCLISSTSEHSK